MINKDVFAKCSICGEKIYLGEKVYYSIDGLIVCEKCFLNELEEEYIR